MLDQPVIIKILGSLAMILIINALCRQLLVSVLLGSLGLALWCGFGFAETGRIAWERFSSADNLCLMVVILQVTWLSAQMASAGVMKDLVEAVRMRISRRASMAVLPAVIGFLPMPGGALFSAPLVDECDPRHENPALLKTQTNYWFRHIWEYWWPLYPAVLLALDITGLEIWRFVLLQVPFSLVAVGLGYWFLLRKVGGPDSDEDRPINGNASNSPDLRETKHTALLPLLLPIIVIISVYAAISLLLPSWAEAQKYLPMILGIVAAMVLLQVQRPLDRVSWKVLLLSGKTLKMAVLVAAVQIYGAFIEADLPDGTPLVEMMRSELAQWGIPAVAMMIILPFVAGFTTGIAIAFVGASMPIAVSLLGDQPEMGHYLAGISLAYICGYAGMILSPVHICLIVTNEFFKTRLYASIAGLVKPVVVLVVVSIAYYLILGW